ncbi:acyltransferase [Phenylobacterium sp.]|jgi:peptidoglycan/LPS O-acetylase OafA/YrhL|uniref:acyltransferase family protein n=1 Tax=Phenylobacterium sp. TaxID=1871053 RepID=UPI002F3E9102
MGTARADDDRYVFLDYLRAAAAWLVAWDHLAVVIPAGLGRVFGPAQAVRDAVAAPLGIIQDFGWFGVALFFLISGFIISDRARVEGVGEFVVKRVLRIYPMLAVAVGLSAAFLAPQGDVTVRNLLLNLTLANYLVIPQVVLLGVAWTLVIEVVFYALTAATQFARGSPHRIALNLAFVALVVWKARAFGGQFFLFAATACYLPILVMGQTVYWWLARRRLSAPWGLGYLLAAYGVFQWGVRSIHTGFLPVANSYLISVTYALLLFIALANVALPERRLVRLLSDTSYSVYLLHGIVGWAVLVALKQAPLTLAILLAAAASLAAAVVAYRLVERPVQRLGRRLTRAWRWRAPPHPVPQAVAAECAQDKKRRRAP